MALFPSHLVSKRIFFFFLWFTPPYKQALVLTEGTLGPLGQRPLNHCGKTRFNPFKRHGWGEWKRYSATRESNKWKKSINHLETLQLFICRGRLKQIRQGLKGGCVSSQKTWMNVCCGHCHELPSPDHPLPPPPPMHIQRMLKAMAHQTFFWIARFSFFFQKHV